MAGERGQATLEYLGLVALVAAVLAAGALLVGGGGVAISASVGRGIQRALCVVRGGECDLDIRPCVVASRGVEDDGSVDLLLVRLGSDEVVLREDRSDGTSAVTFARLRRGGFAGAWGFGAHARLGRRRVRVGAQPSATVLGLLGEATTWALPDRAAAARMVDRVVVDDPRDLARRVLDGGRPLGGDAPPPASHTSQGGASVTLGLGGVTFGAEDLVGQTIGADGRRTYLVRRRNDVAAALDGLAGTGALDELDTLTVDRAGRPLDLGILSGHELSGSVSLPAVVQPAAGFLDVPTSGTRRWETEQHLDLTEPDNLAVAGAFLAQVKAPRPHLGRAVAVSAALRRALEERGVLDARTYALTDTSSGVDAGARVGIGPVGASYERRTRSARLVAAMQRGPGGLWRQRADCLGT